MIRKFTADDFKEFGCDSCGKVGAEIAKTANKALFKMLDDDKQSFSPTDFCDIGFAEMDYCSERANHLLREVFYE